MPLGELEDEVILDEVGGGDNSGAAKPATPAVDPTEEKAKLLATQHIAQLLAIPGVSELLDAHQKGRKMKVLGEEDLANLLPKKEEPVEQEPDYDSLTIKEALSHHQKKVIGALLPELKKIVSESVEPLKQQFGMVEQERLQNRQKTLQQQIEQAAAKYSDWKEMEPHMAKIAGEIKGLEVEEYYLLAKRRLGQPVAPVRGVESERPTHSAAQPVEKDEPLKNGGDFHSFLQRQLGKIKVPDELKQSRW